MTYKNINKAVFIDRPNRFIARCEINEQVETVHVKNTGRCKELLIPGTTVFLVKFNAQTRKTNYVIKGNRIINIDSQAPNKIFLEWAKSGRFLPDILLIKPEYRFLNSRFDFYIETPFKKIFIEIKGATLENNGVVMFPDAPTQRGLKHISELIEVKKKGYEAYIIFVIQMENAKYFMPNYITHKAFADKLKECDDNGVNVAAFDTIVTEKSIVLNNEVEVRYMRYYKN